MNRRWFLSLIIITSYPAYGNTSSSLWNDMKLSRQTTLTFKAYSYFCSHLDVDYHVRANLYAPVTGLTQACLNCLGGATNNENKEKCVHSYRKKLDAIVKKTQEECTKLKPDDKMCGSYSGNNAANIWKEYSELMNIIE